MQWTALELMFGGEGAEGGVGGASAVFFDFSAERVGRRSRNRPNASPSGKSTGDPSPRTLSPAKTAKAVVDNLSRFLSVLRSLKTPLLKASELQLSTPAQERYKRSQLTELWRHRRISNFEYLMRLNTLAGNVLHMRVFAWGMRVSDRTTPRPLCVQDARTTTLRNIQSCPGFFGWIEFVRRCMPL